MKPRTSQAQIEEILAGLAEADRGEFASAEEVKAVFDRHIGADDPCRHPPPHRPPGNHRIGATGGAGASTATPNIGARSAARWRKR